jgi:hypothetical protein
MSKNNSDYKVNRKGNITMKIILIITVLILANIEIGFSYELDGSMSNDGDGNYSVTVENEYGHEYAGEATSNGDGTLDVTVEDYNQQSYSGTLTDNGDGTYAFEANNDSSGGEVSGTVTSDN